MPAPPPRTKGEERRPVLPVKIIPSPQEMGEFEKEEMKKSKLVVKNRLSKLYDQLINYVPKPIKSTIRGSFLRMKTSIMSLCDGAKKILKGYVEGEAKRKIKKKKMLI